ncbi:hypothetical protein GCM10010919_10610 [Alishewanella longhuensis]|uniref:Cellulose-binding protein n=2 Tax=Alishewanella longhuensis TaxID=1091037 RepID=A0ABQ3L0G2_9ALTE|nr:hypothetical protein GCM10010919_10610 [Alishewanella longhuensis]
MQLGTNVPKELNNSANQQVKCILQKLKHPYELISLPWLRARQELRLRRIDGYYTAILLSEMAPFGQLSAPLYLENWYWFEPQAATALDRAERQHGVIRGSHQAKWFESIGITPTVEVNSAEELVLLLKRKRVDSILMDLEAFEETAKRVELDPSEIASEFFRYVPLGVYFSTAYLQQYPDFLAQFNQAIPLCSQTPFTLSASEQTTIVHHVLHQALALAKQSKIQSALAQANQQQWPEKQIVQYDQQWIQELNLQISGLAEAMLQTELSQYLQHWQQQFNGQIAEIMLTDQQGRNVAISELTSDFWQGDEAKFQDLYQSKLDYVFDEVSFDASTQRFLVHLSIPIKDVSEQHIGVLILGIDVELTLQQCQLSDGNGRCL